MKSKIIACLFITLLYAVYAICLTVSYIQAHNPKHEVKHLSDNIVRNISEVRSDMYGRT